MPAMFPDSGVPPQDAKNTLLDPNTINCSELWYSTNRCTPRFDPAAANATLAELINLVNCAGIPYDCTKLDNLCTAIKTMLQRTGDCAVLSGGPADFNGTLDPPLMAYPTDCCMSVKVIPNVNNAAPTRLQLDGLGYLPVFRNDGLPIIANDWIAGIPTIVVLCNGKWINIGFLPSQVPRPLTAAKDIWVNNAFGVDTNDGSANDPAHALATFQKGIDVAFNYQPGPYPVNVHIMNGAGPYAGGMTPIYAGPSLHVIGEGINTRLSDIRFCFLVQGPNNASISNLSVTSPGPIGSGGTICAGNGASLLTDLIYAQACNGGVLQSTRNGTLVQGRANFYGSSYCLFYLNIGGTIDWTDQQQQVMNALSVTVASCFAGGAQGGVPSTAPAWLNPGLVTGAKYAVGAGAVVEDQTAGNNWFPGTLAGGVSNGGVYL